MKNSRFWMLPILLAFLILLPSAGAQATCTSRNTNLTSSPSFMASTKPSFVQYSANPDVASINCDPNAGRCLFQCCTQYNACVDSCYNSGQFLNCIRECRYGFYNCDDLCGA